MFYYGKWSSSEEIKQKDFSGEFLVHLALSLLLALICQEISCVSLVSFENNFMFCVKQHRIMLVFVFPSPLLLPRSQWRRAILTTDEDDNHAESKLSFSHSSSFAVCRELCLRQQCIDELRRFLFQPSWQWRKKVPL
jgi:hypothetical protein